MHRYTSNTVGCKFTIVAKHSDGQNNRILRKQRYFSLHRTYAEQLVLLIAAMQCDEVLQKRKKRKRKGKKKGKGNRSGIKRVRQKEVERGQRWGQRQREKEGHESRQGEGHKEGTHEIKRERKENEKRECQKKRKKEVEQIRHSWRTLLTKAKVLQYGLCCPAILISNHSTTYYSTSTFHNSTVYGNMNESKNAEKL